MKISASLLSADILHQINNPDPLEGEDILIQDPNGKTIGVIIQPKAYEYLLKKISEREDELDSALNESFDPTSKTLSELSKESEND